jgi:hypothetical protein
VKVPKKITHNPSVVKRRRVAQTKKDNTLNKRPRKEKMRPLQKIVNVSQPVVARHLVDTPQSSTQSRHRKESASMSENPDALILENHETSAGMQEISINYTSSGEVCDRSTTITNTCFSVIIAKNFLADPDAKTLTKCKGRSYWNKWT